MRQRYSSQGRLDIGSIAQLELNVECRDEFVPILAGLQHIFMQPALRLKLADLIAVDINEESRSDLGREGFSYWQVVVLATVRLGCNLDFDKLQDLAENHRSLRCLLQVGDYDDTSFNWRRIRDTLCLLTPETVRKINQAIVLHGQLKKAIKKCNRIVSQISSSKSQNVKSGLPNAYKNLIDRAENILERAKTLQIQAEKELKADGRVQLLKTWIDLTEQVCNNAHRRVILGESVPNQEKLISMFETHTQLYRRGKAGTPNQFGRLLLVFEDKAGFISHYHLMDRNVQDKDVIVAQMREVQKLHKGEIERASLDRGFHSEENQAELSKIVANPCLPPKHPQQYATYLEEATVEIEYSRQRHPGVESLIGALQRGNGLKRCRDRSELGMERYIALAIIGRNIQTLGKHVIAATASESQAASSKRNVA